MAETDDEESVEHDYLEELLAQIEFEGDHRILPARPRCDTYVVADIRKADIEVRMQHSFLMSRRLNRKLFFSLQTLLNFDIFQLAR